MVDERYSASSAGWRARKWTVAAVAAGGLAVGAVGVAAAASDAPTPGPQGESTLSDPPAGWRGHGRFAGRGHGLLGGPAVRGEFVVPKSGGGYQTVAMQRETVATVSSSSIRVKSADGVSRTFRVTADTLVNAARDGIGSVKVNDSVAVVAVKSGDTATAVRIVDASRADTSRERFGFRER